MQFQTQTQQATNTYMDDEGKYEGDPRAGAGYKPPRPLTAHQYYLKAWSNLTDQQKAPFEAKANADRERYEIECQEAEKARKKANRKKGVHLSRSYGKVPCVGLDNGFTSYEIIGPAEDFEPYTACDTIYPAVKSQGIKWKSITVDGLVYRHNPAAGTSAYTVGRGKHLRYGQRDLVWHVSNGPSTSYTLYSNYKGETWKQTH